jgi:hypothetical protein
MASSITPSTSCKNHAHAGFHLCQGVRIDHVTRRGIERDVQGDIIGTSQQFFERHQEGTAVIHSPVILGDVICQHLHAEGSRAAGNRTANITDADDAQGFFVQLDTLELFFQPLTILYPTICKGTSVPLRAAKPVSFTKEVVDWDLPHAPWLGSSDVNVNHTHACPANHFQVSGSLQNGSGYFSAAAHHHGM